MESKMKEKVTKLRYVWLWFFMYVSNIHLLVLFHCDTSRFLVKHRIYAARSSFHCNLFTILTYTNKHTQLTFVSDSRDENILFRERNDKGFFSIYISTTYLIKYFLHFYDPRTKEWKFNGSSMFYKKPNIFITVGYTLQCNLYFTLTELRRKYNHFFLPFYVAIIMRDCPIMNLIRC